MKQLAVAGLVLALSSTSAMSAEIWGGLSLDNEVNGEYNIDQEDLTINWTPEVGFSTWNIDLAVSSKIPVWAKDELALADVLEEGSRPNIDMSATYVLTEGWEVYGKTHWDIDESEMGDIKIGATLNF